jgi:hypothetical protein
MSDRSSSPAPVDASALAQLIREMRKDAKAHRAEADTIATLRPGSKRPAEQCERVLAQVHDYFADQLETLLAAPRAPLEPREGRWVSAEQWEHLHRLVDALDVPRTVPCHDGSDDAVLWLTARLRLAARPRPALPQEPPQSLLQKAVADRDARPWNYYKLDHDTMKRMLNQLADQLAARPALGPQE